MKHLLIFICSIGLMACKSGGGSSGTSTENNTEPLTCSKPIFSVWTYQTNSSVIVDMTEFQMGVNQGFVQLTTGETCVYNVAFNGDNCSGTIVTTGATYTGGGSGDPGCSSLNGTETYAIGQDNILVSCADSQCVTLQ